jgi:hypothetical protein
MHSLATRMRKVLFSSVLREVPVVEESGVCQDGDTNRAAESDCRSSSLSSLDNARE